MKQARRSTEPDKTSSQVAAVKAAAGCAASFEDLFVGIDYFSASDVPRQLEHFGHESRLADCIETIARRHGGESYYVTSGKLDSLKLEAPS